MKYDHKQIESQVQKFWQDEKLFESVVSDKPKFYVLDMFPYPSGEGLHVGHVKGYTATDVTTHYKRFKGFNVLHPMGWDAFGLPAENYAIKVGKNPKEVVGENIAKFKSQMQKMGFSYDWMREINTTDPEYYKWTQWIFLKMFEKGLAYQDNIPINFCPSCKTGLANEEVVGGECERCHSKVVRKKLKQWILKITEYADRLLEDLDDLDWPESIKEMQRNWIGKSHGSNIKFKIEGSDREIEVFTTRIDTLYGCTYVVLAPEHELVDEITIPEQKAEVEAYQKTSQNKSDLERIEQKQKTGAFTGAYSINPINGKKVPIWIADYVIAGYGSGAVMAVPAHDERDFEFAKQFNLPIKWVIGPVKDFDQPYVQSGILEGSDEFNGLTTEEAKKQITQFLKEKNLGDIAINYKLKDWVFSRQRYWGEPIPIVHCEKCGAVAVCEDQLPVELPFVENYAPTGTGESPLSLIEDWVNTTCPKCDGPAKRETNTMPQWAGSCWYYLAFAMRESQISDHKSENEGNVFADNRQALEYWMPVDFYVGGAEHAVLHLLYARFWHKFLYDLDLVKDSEPFKKLKNVGLILGPDNQKMSKSRGNVINPNELIDEYGADALRMYELFIGPFDQMAAWNTSGIVGTRKFLDKVFDRFAPKESDSKADLNYLAGIIEDKIEKNLFNTAISDLMKFSNENNLSDLSSDQWQDFLVILSPFAPHLSDHLMRKLTGQSVFTFSWPNGKITGSQTHYVVQINGKKRAILHSDLDENEIIGQAKNLEAVSSVLKGKDIKKTIFVKDKIVNFVI